MSILKNKPSRRTQWIGIGNYTPTRFGKKHDPEKEQKAKDKRARRRQRNLEMKERQS